MSKVREYILEALQREYSFKEDIEIDKINFIEEGYMDSLGLFQFIAELEDEFQIEFTDEEMSSHEFGVVGSLIKLVEKKIM